MKHGTLAFYAATASLIPLALLTYLLSLRAMSAISDTLKVGMKNLLPGDYMGCLLFPAMVAPPACVIIAAIGEISCLNALYTGRPTHINAQWSIAALVAAFAIMGLHIMSLLLTRYFRSLANYNKIQSSEPDSSHS